MNLLSTAEFLSWCANRHIGFDARYPTSNCLVFQSGESCARFWQTPIQAREIPFFLAHLLGGLEPWESCYVWPRGGNWLKTRRDGAAKDQVQSIILRGAGVPNLHSGAVNYSAKEMHALATVLFAQVLFGWSVPDDVFVIPDHGRQIIQTDHHDVIHVAFAEPSAVEPFVNHMAAENYRLPDALPDATFKKPGWMR